MKARKVDARSRGLKMMVVGLIVLAVLTLAIPAFLNADPLSNPSSSLMTSVRGGTRGDVADLDGARRRRSHSLCADDPRSLEERSPGRRTGRPC